jgi:hypothetical protein
LRQEEREKGKNGIMKRDEKRMRRGQKGLRGRNIERKEEKG